jgi:tripartite-type tricarboxylate transporter receptor subunit TctC
MGVVHHARMLAAVCAALVGLATESPAQTPEGFYKGKTVEFIMGYATGGSNDAYSRLIANHLGKHVPGNPTVAPNNIPGAGSFLAVNCIYAVSPKDGTVIGLGAPTMAIDEKLGNPGVRFKASELNWVGRVASLINSIMIVEDLAGENGRRCPEDAVEPGPFGLRAGHRLRRLSERLPRLPCRGMHVRPRQVCPQGQPLRPEPQKYGRDARG